MSEPVRINTGPIEGFRVSVIVPTYNRSHYLRECLDSLLAQTMPAHEIIVVDDGSGDSTAAIVLTYGNRVRYVYKENGGKSSAVNLALELVEGDLVWLFDDDDVALPYAIEARIKILGKSPDAGFVYSPHFLGVDGTDNRIVQGRLQDVPVFPEEHFFHELMKGCFFHLGATLVRTDLYREIGPFDATLVSSEDYDMQLRIARRARAAFCPAPTFIFRQHSGTRGAKTVRYAGAKRTEVFRKYDQVVGCKLRAEVPLGDFLVPRAELDGTSERRRAALLSRMLVMASKGCIPEMMADLHEALATLAPQGSLSRPERQAIADAMCTGYAYRSARDDWPGFLSCLERTVKVPSGPAAVRACVRGLIRVATSYPGSLGDRAHRLGACLSVIGIVYRNRSSQ